MKKLVAIVSLGVLLGSVSPVFARPSQMALYVSPAEIVVPDSLAQQIEWPQSDGAWQDSWHAREEFFPKLPTPAPVKFVYETRKIQVEVINNAPKSQYVETLRCPFAGWIYRNDARNSYYIVMMREDFDKMESACKVGLVDMVVSGYAIDLQTFRVESGVYKGTKFVKEGNKLNRQFYKVKGKKYTVIILSQTDKAENKK